MARLARNSTAALFVCLEFGVIYDAGVTANWDVSELTSG
jgi:hypothetical protein